MNATCNFIYDEAASNLSRIVTICRHCGEVRVTYTQPAPQMDMWTRPPADWTPRPGYLRPRVLD